MGPDTSPETNLAITAAAMSGDAGGLYRLVGGLLDEGIPFDTVLFDVLIPAESGIGLRWQQGDVLIAEEHAATAAVETVVALLAGSLDQPTDGTPVVVAAAEGDAHSLPGRLIAANLLYEGYKTTFLGANVESQDLKEYLQSEEPSALVLSCAMPGHLLGARRAIEASHSAGVPVLAGGRGFGESGVWGYQIGADSWAEHPRDVPRTLSEWQPTVEASESAARRIGPDLAMLADQRMSIIAGAQSAYLELTGDRLGPRLGSETKQLLSAVEAAVLVADPAVVAQTLSWQREMLASQGVPNHQHVLKSLARALSDHSVEAAEMLEAGSRT
ncbi:MAG: cobalamin B12-binding domain-containing protein [Acidimicrobiia bacterium]